MKIKLPRYTKPRVVLFTVGFMYPVAFGMQWLLFKFAPPAGCSWGPLGYGETCTGAPYILAFVYALGTTFLAGIWCSWIGKKWKDRTKDNEPSNPDPAADLRQNWKRSLDD